ncbi:MAG: class I SAM-dependent methyltransferase [Thermodesulfovibrio sp.]|nr:class I SAM-dependent methyltransferase [Thermodesulfovibrio sp.]MCX7724806.1 class I SAM-dependent methyltransferase [Thermodesulfovibrio sp.]
MIYDKTKRLFFEKISETWDEKFYNEKLESKFYSIVSEMNLEYDSLILDVGTGTGNLLKPIISKLGEKSTIFAIDYSEKMLKIAKKKFSKVKNIFFILADAHFMPFRDYIFDTVICFGVFPHFDDKEISVKEISRILKKGGRLFIAHALSSQELREHHRKAPEVSNDFLPEPDLMIKILSSANIKIKRLEDIPGKYFLEGVKE